MKVAFWSSMKKKGSVSTNLACMAAVTAIAGMGKSILLENHYNMNNLGEMLISHERAAVLKENSGYYSKYGVEYVLKRLYTGEAGDKLIRMASVPLLYSSIYYLPQSYVVNKEVFNYEFDLVYKELFQCLESFSNIVFVDTESHGNASTVKILEEADLVVVNLNQDIHEWEDFFEHYETLAKKCMFLVGQYQKEYGWNIARLKKEFHISRESIGAVPYNMELQSAMREGRMLQFLNRNYLKNMNAENEFLMRELKKSAIRLREKMLGTGKLNQLTDRTWSMNHAGG